MPALGLSTIIDEVGMTTAAEDATAGFQVTEDTQFRVTEDGQQRIIE